MLKNITISKDFIRSQPPWMSLLQDEKPLLRGPEYGSSEILANGAGQKKIKK